MKTNRLSSYWGNVVSGHSEVDYSLLLPRGKEEYKEFERSIKKHIDFVIAKTNEPYDAEKTEPFFLFLNFYVANCNVPYELAEKIANEAAIHPQLTQSLIWTEKFPVEIFLSAHFVAHLRDSPLWRGYYQPIHSSMINSRQKDIWAFIKSTLADQGVENPESMPDEWIKKILGFDSEISIRKHETAHA